MRHTVRVVRCESKIMAVKLVRELSGLGLKESLDHVEASASFIVDRDDQRLTDLAEEARRSRVELEFDPPLAGFTSTAAEPQPIGSSVEVSSPKVYGRPADDDDF